MIRASPVTPNLCLGACEPAVSLGWGVSPELWSVLRARLLDSSVFRDPWAAVGAVDRRREGSWVETIVERPAALDVHKAQVTACVRVATSGGRREQHVAEFQTTVRGLLALRDWLAAHGVGQVVMEATGVYWKAPWAILEDEFECLLVNARHVKQVTCG